MLECEDCGRDIETGDDYYRVGSDILCESCMNARYRHFVDEGPDRDEDVYYKEHGFDFADGTHVDY